MSRECQEKNAKGLTMVAIGMNKAADEFLILDDRTAADLASGKYRDQRRGSFGPPPPAIGGPDSSGVAARAASAGAAPGIARGRRSAARTAAGSARKPATKPWTHSQEKLALLYNEQGLRPDEIARKLGISPRLATQIILAARNRGKL